MSKHTEVTVTFLSDTDGYIDGVKQAERATDSLSSSIKDTNSEQQVLVDSNGVLKSSFDDLGGAVTQTSEGILDSTTGFSGLGAATTSIISRMKAATAAMTSFSKAMLATGVGLAIAGIALLITFWDDIQRFIGLASLNLDSFNKATERQNTLANIRLTILRNLGVAEAELSKQRLKDLKLENERALEALRIEQRRFLLKKAFLLAVLGEAVGSKALELITKGYSDSIEDLTEAIRLSASEVVKFDRELKEVDNTVTKINKEVKEIPFALTEWQDIMIQAEADIGTRALSVIEDYQQDIIDARKDTIAEIEDLEEESIINISEKQLQVVRDRVRLQKLVEENLLTFQLQAGADALGATASFIKQNEEMQSSFLVGEALANGAVAIVAATKLPPPLDLFKIASIVAITAAQIGVITSNLGGSSSRATVPTSSVASQQSIATETASPFFFQSSLLPQQQQVLVVEDFNQVSNRIQVVDSRSTIGG